LKRVCMLWGHLRLSEMYRDWPPRCCKTINRLI